MTHEMRERAISHWQHQQAESRGRIFLTTEFLPQSLPIAQPQPLSPLRVSPGKGGQGEGSFLKHPVVESRTNVLDGHCNATLVPLALELGQFYVLFLAVIPRVQAWALSGHGTPGASIGFWLLSLGNVVSGQCASGEKLLMC